MSDTLGVTARVLLPLLRSAKPHARLRSPANMGSRRSADLIKIIDVAKVVQTGKFVEFGKGVLQIA